MSSTLQEPLFTPDCCVLAIFGNKKMTEQEVQEEVCIPLLEKLGMIPTKILLPSEGVSSLHLQSWAEALRIPTQVFQSDWVRNGKIAQILRDDRMQRECSHALVFLSERSKKPEQISKQMVKKGKKVFTFAPLTYLEMPQTSSQASTRARKSDTKTVQTLMKFQKKAECSE